MNALAYAAVESNPIGWLSSINTHTLVASYNYVNLLHSNNKQQQQQQQ